VFLKPSNPGIGSHDARDGLALVSVLARKAGTHISAPDDNLLVHHPTYLMFAKAA
jgi:hypothetical protein